MMKYIPIIIFSAIVVANYSHLVSAEFISSSEEDYQEVVVENKTPGVTLREEIEATSTVDYFTKVLGLFFYSDEVAENEPEKIALITPVDQGSTQFYGPENNPNPTYVAEEIKEKTSVVPTIETPKQVIVDISPTPVQQDVVEELQVVKDTEPELVIVEEESNEEEPPFTDEDIEKYNEYKVALEKLEADRYLFEEYIQNAQLPFEGRLYAVARNNYFSCSQVINNAILISEVLPFVDAIAFTEQHRVSWNNYLVAKKDYCDSFFDIAKKLSDGKSYSNILSWYIEPLEQRTENIQDLWYTILYWDGEVKKQAEERGL